MTGYRRRDDGIVHAAEMVEVKPGQYVQRDVAVALGLVPREMRIGVGRPVEELRAAAPAVRASEVVGGLEGDCSATSCGETLPGAAPGQQAVVPPEVASAPPAAPLRVREPGKAKRSLKDILADCRG